MAAMLTGGTGRDEHEAEAHLLKQLEVQRQRRTDAEARLIAVRTEVNAHHDFLRQQKEEREAARDEVLSLRARVAEAGAENLLTRALELLYEVQTINEEEKELRVSCRAHRSELLSTLNHYRGDVLHYASEEGGGGEEAVYREEERLLKAERESLAKLKLDVLSVRRKVEDIPSRSELMQYERRFVELHEQIQRKHLETVFHFSTHNALADAHKFCLKEISLLDSIHKQFEVAMASAGGRGKMVESLEGVKKGVKQSVVGAGLKLEGERQRVGELRERLATQVGQQRKCFAAVTQLQEVCAKGQKLELRLQQLEMEMET